MSNSLNSYLNIRFILLWTALTLISGGIMAMPPEKRIVGIGTAVYTLPVDEADALEFIYRGMPLSDYVMHSPDFYLRDIRPTLKARKELPWGKSVPEKLWQYFVLPIRVGDEPLDNFRAAYYDELSELVAGKSMSQAAREVADWLYSKVDESPSPGRQMGPKSVVMSALGTAEELATLAVNSFRTIGIPARLVSLEKDADAAPLVQVWVADEWYIFDPIGEYDHDTSSRLVAQVYGDYLGEEPNIIHGKRLSRIVVPSDLPELDVFPPSAYEASLRKAYTLTFFGQKHSPLPMTELNVRFDRLAPRVAKQLERARGNWSAIYDFMVAVEPERYEEAVSMLECLSDKALRDTPRRVLTATLKHTEPDMDDPLYVAYILNPEIDNEVISDYRRAMHAAGSQGSLMSIEEIIKDVNKVVIDNDGNSYNVPITPTEVWRNRRADAHSRDIYFVALCRNNYIPAYIDAATGHPRYHDGTSWRDL